jgi:Holliday junction resolvase
MEGRTAKLERDFQANLVKELKDRFDGCIVMKTDANYIQGLPDLLVLYDGKWAALECKKSRTAKHRPNQDYYVGKMDEMSFSRFIYPENKEEVLDELQQAFES